MTNRDRKSFLATIVVSIGLLVAGAAEVRSTPIEAKYEDVPKQIRAALGELRVSRTPVMLPTWLPSSSKGPLGIAQGPFKDGYEIWLGTSSADTTFFTSAGKGKLARTKRAVKLNDGSTAYIQNLKDFCMDWSIGSYCYRVGLPGYGTRADVAKLVKIANSMKHVPSSIMISQPAGDDRLADYYKVRNIVAAEATRMKVGLLYDSAVKAAAHGDHPKAKLQLDELISKWIDCEEMPPLAQVKMAQVQFLKRVNQPSEAAALEQSCVDSARDLELQLKKVLEDKEKQAESTAKVGDGNSSVRLSLSQARRKLADLYVAEGRYEEAEILYKKAFVGVASVYGRQCGDAISIAGRYDSLLRLWGRNPEPAKELVKSHAAGHAPVRLELASSKFELKGNGADKLIVVLEDEYGAPAAPGCWFTKRAWLHGEKTGTLLWKKPIKLRDGVNMNTAGVDVTGKGTFVLWYTPPGSTVRCSAQRYSWDGINVILKSVTF